MPPDLPAPNPTAAAPSVRRSRARRVGRWLLAGAMLAWLVLLVGWLSLHWLILPHIERWRGPLEAQASRALGAKVTLGTISVESHGWVPSIDLRDVRVLDAEGRVALALPRVAAALSPRSLLAWEPRFSQLYVEAPNLEIRRDAAGRIHVAGLDFGGAAGASGEDDGRAADWFFSQAEFVIAGGTLRWVDEQRPGAPPLALERVDLVVRNHLAGHDIRIDATPPALWGDRFSIRGRFGQPLFARAGDWRRWSGEAYADLPRADVRELRRHVDLPFELAEGDGALRGWVALERGEPTGATVDVALRSVALRLDAGVQPLAFAEVQGRVVFEHAAAGAGSRTRVAVQRFGFLTGDGHRWPSGDLEVAWRQGDAGAVEGGELSADRLDLGVMAGIAGRVPLGAALRGLLAEAEPRGEVAGLKARWDGPLDAPLRYSVGASLSGLSLQARAGERPDAIGRPGFRNGTVRIDATDKGGQARIGVRDGALDLPGVFADREVPLQRFDARLDWTIGAARPGAGGPDVVVRVADAVFANADARGEFAATWRTGPGRVAAAGASAGPAPLVASGATPAAPAGSTAPVAPSVGPAPVVPSVGPAPVAPSVGPAPVADRYPGLLELDGRLADADAVRAVRYLPLGLPDDVRGYVGRALKAGRMPSATMHVRGDLARFPFHRAKTHEDGEFRVAARLEALAFAYMPDEPQWPPVEAASGDVVFDRGRLEVRNGRASIGGVEWRNLAGGIAGLGERPQLGIAGDARAPLADMLRVVRTTPVGRWIGGALDRAAATGSADLHAALAMPIGDAGEARVSGRLVLAGNDLRMVEGTPLLGGARGRVDFSERSFAITGATARVLGGDLAFEGGAADGAAPRFAGQGSFSAEALRRAGELGLASRVGMALEGQAAYRATLAFDGGRPQFGLTSNLSGVSIDLPAPLAKAAATPLPLQLTLAAMPVTIGTTPSAGATPSAGTGTPAGTAATAGTTAAAGATAGTATESLQLELGSVLRARFVRDAATGRLLRGAVRVADDAAAAAPLEAPALPASGIAASLQLARLDIDAWQAAAERFAAAPARAATGAAEAAPAVGGGVAEWAAPLDIAVRVGELDAGGRKLHRVVGTLGHDGADWRAGFVATEAEGSVDYRPPGRRGGGRIVARLARLSLPRGQAEHVENLLDSGPATLPALDIVVDDFELRGKRLGRLEIDAAAGDAPGDREWRLKKLALTMAEARFAATGTWSAAAAPGGGRRSALDFTLAVDDSGALLRRLGMGAVVRGGKGRLAGELSWPGSPLSFETARLAGTVRVAIDSGQFLKASPGAGRLLGVLSMQSLPRRLLLDFRDVFQEGFAFDSVTGDVTVASGVATTHNLRMRGAAAVVLMEGAADLDAETQDLRVVVVPEIDAGTAALAYAIINPAVGLGTFLAQYLLKKPIAEASTREFHVTGPWDDPKVERVGRSAAVAAPPAPLPSPSPSPSPSTQTR